MGVYIRGMEMPTSCNDCPLAGDFKCNLMPSIPALCKEYDMAVQNGKRLNNCPLVEIPPHGRLIDADALTDAIESTDWYHQAPNKEMMHGANSAEHQAWYKEQDIYSALENAPTIIEAEEGE